MTWLDVVSILTFFGALWGLGWLLVALVHWLARGLPEHPSCRAPWLRAEPPQDDP